MADTDEPSKPRGLTLGRALAGLAVAAVAGAAWYYLRDRAGETVETETIVEDGPFALRRHPALLTAETVRPGTRAEALEAGFGLLADYIFAESREGDPIAMVAPVLAEQEAESGWRVRFVMPAGVPRAALPATGPELVIGALPEARVAAIRFAGRASDALFARKEAALRAWMGHRRLVPAGPARHAHYNAPLIPGPLRHNEIWIAVE